MGAVEGGDEGSDHGVIRDALRGPHSLVVRAGSEERGIDAIRHLDQLGGIPLGDSPQVRHRSGVVSGEDADAVRGIDQQRRDGVLVGLERDLAGPLRDQAVLVVDEEGLPPPAAGQAADQRQLRAEDEGVVHVHHVEPVDPREARDQGSVADGEDRLDPVHQRFAGVRGLALGRCGEDLDVVAPLSLALREPVGGVARPAGVRGKGRRQVRDPQPGPGLETSRTRSRRVPRLASRALAVRGSLSAQSVAPTSRSTPACSIVLWRPSRSSTSGSQPSSCFARVMSGWRTCGSSTGSAS